MSAELEAKIAKLEQRLDVAQATALMGLRLAYDHLSFSMSEGGVPRGLAVVQGDAAQQVGEGAPHCEVEARGIAHLLEEKLPMPPS